jgi:hypothetical protein
MVWLYAPEYDSSPAISLRNERSSAPPSRRAALKVADELSDRGARALLLDAAADAVIERRRLKR